MSSTLHFFSIPALAPMAAQNALNQFLTQHRVVALEKQWLSAGADSHWAVCVTVALGQDALPSVLKLPSSKGGRVDKVDYREVLNPDDFGVFAVLRALRQSMAAQEGVPPYALFTNEQLAAMARQRPADAAALRSIDGVGEARAGKYGVAFLNALRSQAITADQS
jgi:superfamily II DNA helicase RecQ